MLPEGIQRIPMRRWENKHQNFKQKLNKKASFKIQNPDSVTKSADRYRASTKNFQWLIQHAQANNLKMRALGSGWSFSKVGVTDGGIIDTKSLSLTFTVSEDHINDQYVGQKEDLLFCQCGIAIETLNVILEEKLDPKRSLKASGASNGQSIVGAMSTGTHGSAFDVGSLQDFVVGLHLVVGANRHVYIERSSYPVVNDGFKNWLGDDTEWIRDDTVFNAALVCFGSFGFIHGVMIETEPIYLLQEERGMVQYDEALRECIDTLNFDLIEDKLAFPANTSDKQLYHFEMVVNPHRFHIGASDNEVFLKTLYKKPYKSGYQKRPAPDAKYTYGDDLLGLIQSVLDAMPRLSHHYIPSLVNMLFPLAFTDKIEGEGTVGETFTYTKFRGKVASAALG
ncbi:MAG: FAD-binding protein, partial [Bacteroidota bacterium]